jgi:RHS repeat-associated protein
VHRTAWPGPLEAVTLSVHDLAGSRLAEHDGSGAVIREYIWLDGRPLAVVEGGQTFWLHWDHILRPVLATDATGAVVWAARYLPFGGIDQVLADTGVLTQTLRFPGQWFQAETGLHQNWMRDYDPTTGRYLQADPLGLVDGPSVYGYARQSPVRWTDPRGEDSLDAFLCFMRNFNDMKEANTIGADKYFHCKANCCAARKSSKACARRISDFREDFQDYDPRGDNSNPTDRVNDRALDELANQLGRDKSDNRLQSCRTVCFQYRVNGLPEKY